MCGVKYGMWGVGGLEVDSKWGTINTPPLEQTSRLETSWERSEGLRSRGIKMHMRNLRKAGLFCAPGSTDRCTGYDVEILGLTRLSGFWDLLEGDRALPDQT